MRRKRAGINLPICKTEEPIGWLLVADDLGRRVLR